MNLEFNNISMIPFDKTQNPNDAYAGIRYATNEGLAFTAGASLGKIGGPSGDDYRIVAGIRYTIFEDKKQLPKPVYIAPFAAAANGNSDSNSHASLADDKITTTTPVYFVYNSSVLQPSANAVLDDVAALMKRNPKAYKKIFVDGHTGVVGTEAYNQTLSLERAKVVKAYLVKKGVSAAKLEARGFGLSKPKVAKDTPLALVINERIEFNLVK